MFQDEGASIDVMGIEVSSKAVMRGGKGGRISSLKLKPKKGLTREKIYQGRSSDEREKEQLPKTASMMWCVVFSEVSKSSVNGILRV